MSGSWTDPGRIPARQLAVVLALFFGGAALYQAQHGLGELRASAVLLFAERQANQMMTQGQAQIATVRRTLDLLEPVAEQHPDEPGLLLAVGSYYLMSADPNRAQSWYRRAIELEPRSEAYLNLARAQRLLHKDEETRKNFEIAMRLSPSLRLQVPEEFGGAMERARRRR